jgi:hypothetical protein
MLRCPGRLSPPPSKLTEAEASETGSDRVETPATASERAVPKIET